MRELRRTEMANNKKKCLACKITSLDIETKKQDLDFINKVTFFLHIFVNKVIFFLRTTGLVLLPNIKWEHWDVWKVLKCELSGVWKPLISFIFSYHTHFSFQHLFQMFWTSVDVFFQMFVFLNICWCVFFNCLYF